MTMPAERRPLEARWREVSRILDRLLEIPAEQRITFIARELGQDAELRQLVEQLLEADARSNQFLGPSAQILASSLLEHTPESVAKRLGRYEILGRLGSGGMGEVFEARDRQLHRRVAIKVLAASHALSEKGRKRFLREARAASSVDHPNICTVHDVGETDQHLYIVMSRYEGETLEARLQKGRLSADQALEIARQITCGLSCAHDKGIVHRDIKPANIFLVSGGNLKILDFGIAMVLGETRLTRTGAPPGTLAYMAPELIEGTEADGRADLWSVGVLLHQMISGQLPFERESVGATVHAILHKPAAPLPDVDLPPGVDALLKKALAKRPDDRFSDARELLTSLGGPYDAGARRQEVALPGARMGSLRIGRLGGRVAWGIGLAVAILATSIWIGARMRAPSGGETRDIVTIDRFENRATDDVLAWLGTAIASMLSCDLAQNEALVVVSGCGLSNDGATAQSAAEIAAGETGLRRVRGSYLASAGRLRLDVSIFDRDGQLLTNKVLQRDVDEVLLLVAEASDFVRSTLGVATDGTTWLASEAMTTASLEAWRYYNDALGHYLKGNVPSAIQAFELAIAEDPEFALALADLGLLFANSGDLTKARKYLDRAMIQGHRLPLAQRDRVQAEVLASSWEGYAAAADILERLISRHPAGQPERDHLAAIYGWLEAYADAARLYEGLIADGTAHYGTYESAASVYVALGRFDRAHEIVETAPPDVAAHWRLRWKRGWILLEQGALDKARRVLSETAKIPAAAFLSRYELWRLAIAEQSWLQARLFAEAMIAAAKRDGATRAFEVWWGEIALARTMLFLGDVDAALAAFDRATHSASDSPLAAVSLCLASDLSLALGQAGQAQRMALRAQELGDQQWPWLMATALLSLAYEQLGRSSDADDALASLAQRALNADNQPEIRLSERFAGRLALQRARYLDAAASLGRAASRLPPRGIEFHDHRLPDHVAIWFELGLAEKRAGRDASALEWLGRVEASGVQMVQAPLAWVRSLYHLAELHQRSGDVDIAVGFYRRFLDLRSPGGLDADLVARTVRALDELRP